MNERKNTKLQLTSLLKKKLEIQTGSRLKFSKKGIMVRTNELILLMATVYPDLHFIWPIFEIYFLVSLFGNLFTKTVAWLPYFSNLDERKINTYNKLDASLSAERNGFGCTNALKRIEVDSLEADARFKWQALDFFCRINIETAFFHWILFILSSKMLTASTVIFLFYKFVLWHDHWTRSLEEERHRRTRIFVALLFAIRRDTSRSWKKIIRLSQTDFHINVTGFTWWARLCWWRQVI